MKMPPRQDIEYLYLTRQWSYKQIAQHYNVSSGSVNQWIIRLKLSNRVKLYHAKPTANELFELYHLQQKNTTEIGVIYQCSGRLISKWMQKHNIPTRQVEKPSQQDLERWYVVEMQTTTAIARRLQCSHRTILNWLESYGISVRTNSQAQMVAHGTNHLTAEVLRQLYKEKGLSQSQIAQQFDLTQTAIKERMRKAAIPARSKANLGSKNGMHGRIHTPEAIAKIREANRKQFADPAIREAIALKTIAQIQAGHTGKSYNKLEQRVATMLDATGVEYSQQYRLGRFLFDFYLPLTHTLLEVHGTFWHADPRVYAHKPLSKIQQRNVANDIKKAACAAAHGYRLAVLWEADVT